MGVYVKWWIFGPIVGLLLLSGIREHLFEKNLFDTNVDYPANVACTGRALTARTVDGTCNDLSKTKMGAAGMRFGRNVPLNETMQDTDNLLNPNPRDISRDLLTRNQIKEVPFLNYLAASWIQFMIHDWFSHGVNNPSKTINVSGMQVSETRDDPTQNNNAGEPLTFQNTVTAWWDGSQIYGSDQATNTKVRSGIDGKLKLDASGRLPVDATKGIDVTGFSDNWWVGLSMMHHLFTLEHNAIATMLKAKYPSWDDQKLFDTARLVNAALMAKIHTIEWTPAILKNRMLRTGMEANWHGLLPGTKTGNPVISGFMGGKQEHHSAPFSLTEEFTAVYRMHPLLRDEVAVRNAQNGSVVETVSLQNSAHQGATATLNKHGLTNLFFSFGMTHPGLLELNNFPKFLQALPAGRSDNPGVVDMGAVDILRDRERGVPRYNEFRRLINLKPIETFDDLTPNAALAAKISAAYNGNVEALDLMIGSYAEGYRPPGYGFGETSFQIFIAMASRRLNSDRFFTTNYNAATYSAEGMKWVENNGMKSVLIRNMPALATTLKDVGNAFFPWDEKSVW